MSAVSDPSAPQNEKPDPSPAVPMQARPALPHKSWPAPARLDIGRTWPALFLIVTVILYWRISGVLRNPNLFAEDGMVLFKQQYEQGFFSALLTHYAGYLLFAPHIVAAICALLPLESVPVAYNVAALLIAAAVLSFFFAPGFRTVIDSDSLRAGIAIIFTLMPNNEPLMKLAYVNWYMLFFIALITLYTLPQRPAALWLFFLPAAVAVWSTPVGIVCLPVIGLRAWSAANRMERLWWLALALTMIGYSLTAERVPPATTGLLAGHDLIRALVHAIGYRVFCFFFLGQTHAYTLLYGDWNMVTGLSLLLGGICAGGTAWAFVRTQAPGNARRVPLVLFYLILASSAMFVLRTQYWHFFLEWSLDSWGGSGRYFFCSTLLLCVLCGVIYERVLRGCIAGKNQQLGIGALFLLGWLLLHQPGFKLWVWPAADSWEHYTREIRAAEARALLTGGSESVHIASAIPGFDFDLHINPAAARRDHAGKSL